MKCSKWLAPGYKSPAACDWHRGDGRCDPPARRCQTAWRYRVAIRRPAASLQTWKLSLKSGAILRQYDRESRQGVICIADPAQPATIGFRALSVSVVVT